MKNQFPNGVMLNAYPDSIGENLSDIVALLKSPEFKDVFSLFYILPSVFNSDLDRGFSVIEYNLNAEFAKKEDLEELEKLNIQLKFDLVLNHLSVGSPQFQDLLQKGDDSIYKDFFIDWNEFWKGEGKLSAEGHVIPDKDHFDQLFMRKPGLPILKVRFPDGSDRFYWNTFYQKVNGQGRDRSYLGQMDLNAQSPKVWEFYEETLRKLSSYGTKILRLDAFAYLHKEIGQSNFFNRPGTWEYLERLKVIAEDCGLILLPEIHAEYGTGVHEDLSEKDFPIYDFFLPGLIIDALDSGSNKHLVTWINDIIEKDLKTVNMLGCHDGIPVIDLKGGVYKGQDREGLLEDQEIEFIIDRLLARGGRVKNLYGPDGSKISYYQVNATFFSALGEDENRLRLARAIQLFMPGTPQIWYLDLFAGKNDQEAADRAGQGGHKEINRTNLSMKRVEAGLQRPIVKDQLEMIRLRNTSKAFDGIFDLASPEAHTLIMTWTNGETKVSLDANLKNCEFIIKSFGEGVEKTIIYS